MMAAWALDESFWIYILVFGVLLVSLECLWRPFGCALGILRRLDAFPVTWFKIERHFPAKWAVSVITPDECKVSASQPQQPRHLWQPSGVVSQSVPQNLQSHTHTQGARVTRIHKLPEDTPLSLYMLDISNIECTPETHRGVHPIKLPELQTMLPTAPKLFRAFPDARSNNIYESGALPDLSDLSN